MYGFIVAMLLVFIKFGIFDADLMDSIKSSGGYLYIYYWVTSALWVFMGIFVYWDKKDFWFSHPMTPRLVASIILKFMSIQILFLVASKIMILGATQGNVTKLVMSGLVFGLACVLQWAWSAFLVIKLRD